LRFLVGLLLGLLVGLSFGFSFGVAIEDRSKMDWHGIAMRCVQELLDCEDREGLIETGGV